MQGAVGAVLPNERLSEVPECLADELMAADEEFWVAYRDFLLSCQSDDVCRRMCDCQTRLIKAARTVAMELRYRSEG